MQICSKKTKQKQFANHLNQPSTSILTSSNEQTNISRVHIMYETDEKTCTKVQLAIHNGGVQTSDIT